MEIYIRNAPSAFALKAKYYKQQKTLDLIILGSSHSQNGTNPRFLKYPGANLAYGSQDLLLDKILLENAIRQGKQPKIVILELSYHRLFRENEQPYWRNGLYDNFYDIETGNLLSKHILTSSNLKFFKSFILERIDLQRKNEAFNEWGFNENDYEGIFKNMKYDSLAIAKNARTRITIANLREVNQSILNRNKEHLFDIAEICHKHNIKLILVAPPVFRTYSDFFLTENLNFRNEVILKLHNKYNNIKFYTFENTDTFKVTHFKNDDHLNAKGAELFTTLLNSYIEEK
jgi:hypothetical protein